MRPFARYGASVAAALLTITICSCAPHDRATGAPRPRIEIVHWLASREESAALGEAREAFARHGVWRETPLPGVAIAQSTVINRAAGGDPPAVFQVSVGAQLAKLAERGVAGPAPVDAALLDRSLPPIIAQASKYQGRYVAVPTYIRGENWMFYNKALLSRFGLRPPKTWPEFLAAARTLKAGGVTPIALGGQPWQERILFNAVLLGVGGRDFYRRVYVDRDPTALNGPIMRQVFATMAELRGFVDATSPGRPWPQATAMVRQGHAAFQFMGDWAKSGLRGEGDDLDPAVGCELAPAIEPGYIVAVDAFAFSRSSDPASVAGQNLFAQVMLDPQVQRSMSQTLGSAPVLPARSTAGFDRCARLAMDVMTDRDRLLPSTGLFALPAPLSGAVDDVIAQFWHQPNATPAQGQRAFARAFALYGATTPESHHE